MSRPQAHLSKVGIILGLFIGLNPPPSFAEPPPPPLPDEGAIIKMVISTESAPPEPATLGIPSESQRRSFRMASYQPAGQPAPMLVVADRVMVRFKPSVAQDQINVLLAKYNLSVTRRMPKTNIFLLRSVNLALADLIADLKAESIVANAEPDQLVFPTTPVEPNDPLFGTYQWSLHNTGVAGMKLNADIQGPEAWEFQKGSTDVVIAIIDHCVYLWHPDILGNYYWNFGEYVSGG